MEVLRSIKHASTLRGSKLQGQVGRAHHQSAPSVNSASVHPSSAPRRATSSTSGSVMYARRPGTGACAKVQ